MRINTARLLGIMAVMAGLIVSCSPAATPTSAKPATFDDPFAYCAAVGTIDAVDARYAGEPLPESIVKAIRVATGASADAPAEWFQRGTFWRCMDGKVYGCFVGANIPCESKANTDKTPTTEMSEFCQAQPNAEVIPAVATGHETVYEWHCKDGKPEIVKQVIEVDARGYPANFWYPLSPQ